MGLLSVSAEGLASGRTPPLDFFSEVTTGVSAELNETVKRAGYSTVTTKKKGIQVGRQ